MSSRKDKAHELDELNKKQLLDIASEAKVAGRTRMRKDQLKRALLKIPGVERIVRRLRSKEGADTMSRKDKDSTKKKASTSVEPPEGSPSRKAPPEGVMATKRTPPEGRAGRPPGLDRRKKSRVTSQGSSVKSSAANPSKGGKKPARGTGSDAAVEPASVTGATSTGAAPVGESFACGRLVLMVVDPFWAFAYWEVATRVLEQARTWLGDPGASLVLRFQEQTGIGPYAQKTGETFDIPVAGSSGKQYVNLWSPGKHLVAELGLLSAAGGFLPVARSNELSLPRNAESESFFDQSRSLVGQIDPHWKPRSEPRPRTFEKPVVDTPAAEAALASSKEDTEQLPLYARPGGRLSAGVVGRPEMTEPLDVPDDWKLEFGLSSGELITGSVSSLAVPVKDDKVRLDLDAEVVVRGRTAPGTDLIIEGVRVPVEQDGTFCVRFQLPSQRQALGIEAQSLVGDKPDSLVVGLPPDVPLARTTLTS